MQEKIINIVEDNKKSSQKAKKATKSQMNVLKLSEISAGTKG